MSDYFLERNRARLVELDSIQEAWRDSLGIAETQTHVPFAIRRAKLHHDLPLNDQRGKHAHRELEEFIVCLTGAVVVEARDKTSLQSFQLDSPLRVCICRL